VLRPLSSLRKRHVQQVNQASKPASLSAGLSEQVSADSRSQRVSADRHFPLIRATSPQFPPQTTRTTSKSGIQASIPPGNTNNRRSFSPTVHGGPSSRHECAMDSMIFTKCSRLRSRNRHRITIEPARAIHYPARTTAQGLARPGGDGAKGRTAKSPAALHEIHPGPQI